MSFYQQPLSFYQQPGVVGQSYGFYQQPGFVGQQPGFVGQQPYAPPLPFPPAGEPLTPLTEQSFIENILRLNIESRHDLHEFRRQPMGIENFQGLSFGRRKRSYRS